VDGWGNDLRPEEVGRDLGIPIPTDRPMMLYTLRAVMGGF
jgi:hypothetical protein